jgi:DNA mismatch endonuclease (patch repair protein)
MDRLTVDRRSENMRRIRSRNTSPELIVRRFLHRAGFRYRLHAKSLPGKPDVVLPALRACVLIHGCFWHGCAKCIDGTRRVKSRSTYWVAKIRGNQERDVRHTRALRHLGWKVYVLWECELQRPASLRRLARSLEKRRLNTPRPSRTSAMLATTRDS